MSVDHPRTLKPGLKRFLRILLRSTFYYAATVSIALTVLAGFLRISMLMNPGGADLSVESSVSLSEIGSLAALAFFVCGGVGFCVGWCWAIYHATVNRLTAIVAYAVGGPIGGIGLVLYGQLGVWASNCALTPDLCKVPDLDFRLGYLLVATLISYFLIIISRLNIGLGFRFFTWPID